jgi:pimeloyl-ACP methyl ester carboxylesterase
MQIARKLALSAVGFVILVLVAPPLYYVMRDPERPALPDPGRAVELQDGTRLNLLDSGRRATAARSGGGNAGPIVLVHGLPGSAYDWQPLYARLSSSGRRVMAYDRKGYGHSDVRAEGEAYSVDANAVELLQLLRAIDVRDVTLVGWSYGGGVTIRAAEIDRSRIANVVLLASIGPHPAMVHPGAFEQLLFTEAVLAWLARVPPASLAATEAISREAYSDGPMPEWWVPQTRANLARAGTLRAMVREGLEWPEAPLAPEAIDRPVLVIHGTDDRSVPFVVGEDLHARTQPGSELLRVEGGSHMLPITHSELLAERILAFSAAGERPPD